MEKIDLLLDRIKEMTKDLEIHNKVVLLVDEVKAEHIKIINEVAKSCKKEKR